MINNLLKTTQSINQSTVSDQTFIRSIFHENLALGNDFHLDEFK